MRNNQVSGVVADVGYGQRRELVELILSRQVVLIRLLGLQVQIPCTSLEERRGSRAAAGSSKAGAADDVRESGGDVTGRTGVEIHVRFDKERRVQRQAQIRTRAFQITGEAIPGADHHLVLHCLRRPGNSQSRLELLLVALVQRRTISATRQNQLTCEGVDVDLAIGHFADRRVVFPAHAEVQRQIALHLPVVLEENPIAPLTVAPFTGHRATALGSESVQQEIAIRLTRIATVVAEAAERAIVTSVITILLHAEQLSAHLDQVRASLIGGHDSLLILIVTSRADAGAAADAAQPVAQADRAQAGDRLTAGNTRFRIAVSAEQAGPVDNQIVNAHAAETDAGVDHKARRDRARPVDHGAESRSVRSTRQEHRKCSLRSDLIVLAHRETAREVVFV